jgi:CRISPR-associated protein Csm2
MPAETKNAHNQAYFTKDGVPRHELFDAEAQEEARKWAEIRSSQVRRFFGQAHADRRNIEIKRQNATDEDALVAMAFLKATSAYAAAREKARKPLADFAKQHADVVKSIKDLKVFLRHFEAVVAWHRVFEEEKKANEKGERRNFGGIKSNYSARGRR